jgi:hypothetical protein
MMDERTVPSDAELWTRARRHLLKYGGEFVNFVPVRAEGVFLYDASGRRVLDFTSGQMSALLCSAILTRRSSRRYATGDQPQRRQIAPAWSCDTDAVIAAMDAADGI